MKTSFTFVDLCCGIGGFHIACQRNDGICIQACDIDDGARELYFLNHGVQPGKDVKSLSPPLNAKIDLVCFGNPCQSFSSIGLRRGLSDKRGKVFFSIVNYLNESKANAFIMENVKGLVTLNKGRDFKRMLRLLQDLGYHVSYRLLNALDFGVGQSRERVFVVGHRDRFFDFDKIELQPRVKNIRKSLNTAPPNPSLKSQRFDELLDLKAPLKKTKTGFVIRAEIAPYTEKRLFSSNGVIGTIMSSMSPFIYDERHRVVRNLDVKELLRLQSFPEDFKFPPGTSRTKALKYIGNAVCVNVVDAIVRQMRSQKLL